MCKVNLGGSEAETLAYGDSEDFPPKILDETKCPKKSRKKETAQQSAPRSL
jgi:hypothetical protein